MAIIKIRNAAIDLDAAEIPNLPASKITSGTFADARIADLSASKLTGSISDARLPANALNSNVDLTNLSASNLTSGTIPTARITALPTGLGGKVLQVVNVQKDSSFVTSSSSAVDYGLTCSITPSSASNYIILNVALGGVRVEGSTYIRAWVYKQIGGGGYSSHDQIEAGFGYSGSSLIKTQNLVKMLKISPNTTSQVDFKIYVASANGSENIRLTVDGVESSTLTAYEIKG